MSKQLSLAEYKCILATWDKVVEKAREDYRYVVNRRAEAKRNMMCAERKAGLGIFVPLVCAILILLMAGCCTMTGAGKDVQRLSDGWMAQQSK